MKNNFWIIISISIWLLSCSGNHKSEQEVNRLRNTDNRDIDNSCIEDKATDEDRVAISYRDR